jgi:hypothetical protein
MHRTRKIKWLVCVLPLFVNLINVVFDETRSMSGHQSNYQHIIDRTFLRPRDIIKFCNEVLIAYKRREDTKLERFDNDNVKRE